MNSTYTAPQSGSTERNLKFLTGPAQEKLPLPSPARHLTADVITPVSRRTSPQIHLIPCPGLHDRAFTAMLAGLGPLQLLPVECLAVDLAVLGLGTAHELDTLSGAVLHARGVLVVDVAHSCLWWGFCLSF